MVVPKSLRQEVQRDPKFKSKALPFCALVGVTLLFVLMKQLLYNDVTTTFLVNDPALQSAATASGTSSGEVVVLEKKKNMNEARRDNGQWQLQVPLPIFVPSLPKSGTSTAHRYFECGHLQSSHLTARFHPSKPRIGQCVQRELEQGIQPFTTCGPSSVWTDTGLVGGTYGKWVKRNYSFPPQGLSCFYPLIQALEPVYEAHPNATWLFLVRETESWAESMLTYSDGFIWEAWKVCRSPSFSTGSVTDPNFPGPNSTRADLVAFYEWHKNLMRTFAHQHPSLTYIELPLEGETTAQDLEEKVGIPSRCWGHRNRQRTKKKGV